MTNAPAKFTQVDLRRAIKAARAVDPKLTVNVSNPMLGKREIKAIAGAMKSIYGTEAYIRALMDGSYTICPGAPRARIDHLTNYSDERDEFEIRKTNSEFIKAQKNLGVCVYFIEAMNRVKIGYAKDLADRLERFQVGCPVALAVLGVVPGGKEREREIHEKMYRHRTIGEWFRIHPEITAYIGEHGIHV